MLTLDIVVYTDDCSVATKRVICLRVLVLLSDDETVFLLTNTKSCRESFWFRLSTNDTTFVMIGVNRRPEKKIMRRENLICWVLTKIKSYRSVSR